MDLRWVGVAQVKLLVGFHIPRHQRVFKTLAYLVSHIRETRPQELAMGLTWLAALLIVKAAARRHPYVPPPPHSLPRPQLAHHNDHRHNYNSTNNPCAHPHSLVRKRMGGHSPLHATRTYASQA